MCSSSKLYMLYLLYLRLGEGGAQYRWQPQAVYYISCSEGSEKEGPAVYVAAPSRICYISCI